MDPIQFEVVPFDGGWRVRRTDYEFLTSPQARELLRQEGIVVIDYRPLQQVWSQTRGDWSGPISAPQARYPFSKRNDSMAR